MASRQTRVRVNQLYLLVEARAAAVLSIELENWSTIGFAQCTLTRRG